MSLAAQPSDCVPHLRVARSNLLLAQSFAVRIGRLRSGAGDTPLHRHLRDALLRRQGIGVISAQRCGGVAVHRQAPGRSVVSASGNPTGRTCSPGSMDRDTRSAA